MELPSRPTKDPYQELPVKDFSYINTQKQSNNKTGHRWIWIVSGVVILILLGAGAFTYGHYTKKTTKAKTVTTVKVAKKPTTSTQANLPNVPTTSYSSSTFNLTVNYPTTWAVTASGSTSMSITSPEMALTTDSGKSVEGKVVINVLNQGQLPAAFGSNTVAVLNSQDITFSNPTANQAAQTYISFAQYPTTTASGGLDAIYITGNNGYVKDQTIPSTDVNAVSPLIFVNFEQCPDSTCSSPTPVTISSTMWSNPSFQAPIIVTLKSFSLS